jgi:hypothetical protein
MRFSSGTTHLTGAGCVVGVTQGALSVWGATGNAAKPLSSTVSASGVDAAGDREPLAKDQ